MEMEVFSKIALLVMPTSLLLKKINVPLALAFGTLNQDLCLNGDDAPDHFFMTKELCLDVAQRLSQEIKNDPPLALAYLIPLSDPETSTLICLNLFLLSLPLGRLALVLQDAIQCTRMNALEDLQDACRPSNNNNYYLLKLTESKSAGLLFPFSKCSQADAEKQEFAIPNIIRMMQFQKCVGMLMHTITIKTNKLDNHVFIKLPCLFGQMAPTQMSGNFQGSTPSAFSNDRCHAPTIKLKNTTSTNVIVHRCVVNDSQTIEIVAKECTGIRTCSISFDSCITSDVTTNKHCRLTSLYTVVKTIMQSDNAFKLLLSFELSNHEIKRTRFQHFDDLQIK